MERDAVAVAFPDWEWRDDDVVTVSQEYDSGYYYSEYTNEPASFKFHVSVRRETPEPDGLGWNKERWCEYRNEEAGQFWSDLMRKGSER